jgi:deoxycytidylate deaminase
MRLSTKIKYPYMPKGRTISYVDSTNKFMLAAKEMAKRNSLDKAVPTGSVIVLEDKIVGEGANGSDYHLSNPCQRVLRGIPTGQGYELCEGCHPKNHSEPKAIANALTKVTPADLFNAQLYLWGHWWLCEPCWNAIKKAGIKKIYLQKNSHKHFNKEHPENIMGGELV